MIRDAYQRAFAEGVPATDDAALVERLGGRVVMVESSVDNFKITRPENLSLAEVMVSRRQGTGEERRDDRLDDDGS